MRKKSLVLILIITSVGYIYGPNFGGRKESYSQRYGQMSWNPLWDDKLLMEERKTKKISMNIPSLPPRLCPLSPISSSVLLTFIKDSSEARPGASSFICIISLTPPHWAIKQARFSSLFTEEEIGTKSDWHSQDLTVNMWQNCALTPDPSDFKARALNYAVILSGRPGKMKRERRIFRNASWPSPCYLRC